METTKEYRPGSTFQIALIIVLLSVGVRTWFALKPWVESPVRDLTENIDWGYLNGGLDEIECFADTGRWWTGTWCGEVPFWRPLTSYALWGMKLLWPEEYLLPRQIVLVTMHLVFVGLAAVFLQRLTGRPWLVLLTVALFAGLRPHRPTDPQVYQFPVYDTMLDPKNIPDPLAGIAVIGALLLLCRGRWIAGLAAAAAAVGFKEIGFTVWPLALAMFAWMHRERVFYPGGIRFVRASIQKNSRAVAAWSLALLALGVIHVLAVGVGFREGSNELWYGKMTMFFGWPVFANLLLFDKTGALIACLVVGSLVLTRRRRLPVKMLGITVALFLSALVDALWLGTTWGVSLTRIIVMGASLNIAVLCLGWFLVIWLARREWRLILMLFTLAFIAALPSWMAAQTWAHTRYVASFFMEAAVAAALCANGRAIAEFARKHFAEVTPKPRPEG